MKRKIIHIDEGKCTGCGLCIPNCPEGAIQVIGGKARLLGDLFCDGLGACIGECPEGAITVEEREAEPYDEAKVMENIIPQGDAVIRAHLSHLESHGETGHYATALSVLEKHHHAIPGTHHPAEEQSRKAPDREKPETAVPHEAMKHEGCPGARSMRLGDGEDNGATNSRKTGGRTSESPDRAPNDERPSRLSTWPVQLHLLPPRAPYFKNADLVLCADCVAYAVGNFHERYLPGNVLAIACPKLDDGQEIYLEKLKTIIDESGIRSLTVLTMEVPCCSGLARLAGRALAESKRKDIAVIWKVISLKGEEIRDTVLSGC